MDVSNALVTSQFARSIQENRNERPAVENRVGAPTKRSESATVDIDADEIVKRGQLKESERVQRLDNLDSASLKTQEAINVYTQTEQSTRQSEQGELVGVDLFV